MRGYRPYRCPGKGCYGHKVSENVKALMWHQKGIAKRRECISEFCKSGSWSSEGGGEGEQSNQVNLHSSDKDFGFHSDMGHHWVVEQSNGML